MFRNCVSLREVDIPACDINVEKCDCTRMFSGCKSLTKLNMGGVRCKKFVGAGVMLTVGCELLKEENKHSPQAFPKQPKQLKRY